MNWTTSRVQYWQIFFYLRRREVKSSSVPPKTSSKFEHIDASKNIENSFKDGKKNSNFATIFFKCSIFPAYFSNLFLKFSNFVTYFPVTFFKFHHHICKDYSFATYFPINYFSFLYFGTNYSITFFNFWNFATVFFKNSNFAT